MTPQILRQPGFHRAVGRIHRAIHEKQHGRNPHEPLAPGEATGKMWKELLPLSRERSDGKPCLLQPIRIQVVEPTASSSIS